MTQMKTHIIMLALPLILTACDKPHAVVNAMSVTDTAAPTVEMTIVPENSDSMTRVDNATPDTQTAAGWVGRWLGPEGLFLDIAPAADGTPEHFALTLKDTLDGQASYDGIGKNGIITFMRSGKTQTIRPGSGAETGFKYLMDKKDCLIVQAGKEGYCR